MSNYVKLILVFSLALMLGACTSIRQNFPALTRKSDTAYLKAKATPPLKVPDNLSRAKVGDSYAIPRSTGAGKVPASITPPGGVHKRAQEGNPKKAKKKSSYFLQPLF